MTIDTIVARELGVHELAMGIATMTSWGFKLRVALTFPLLVEALGAALTFWIYRAAVATLVFWHRFVPKRKAWSLEEIIVHWYRFRRLPELRYTPRAAPGYSVNAFRSRMWSRWCCMCST